MATELTRKQVALIAEAILARGMDLERLGEAAGLGPAVVPMIMDGTLRPEAHIRRRLAAALGIDPALIGEQ